MSIADGKAHVQKDILISFIMSLAVVAIPASAIAIVDVPDWFDHWLGWTTFGLAPGFIAVAISGNIHDYSRLLVVVTSLGCYWIFFWLLLVLGRRFLRHGRG
jgi:ribose/xylose/arabinose/galactoside ABC-type transport system permease subunit